MHLSVFSRAFRPMSLYYRLDCLFVSQQCISTLLCPEAAMEDIIYYTVQETRTTRNAECTCAETPCRVCASVRVSEVGSRLARFKTTATIFTTMPTR